MTTTDFMTSIQMNGDAGKVYAALTTGIADWWTRDMTGSGAKLKDIFIVRFGNTTKTMEVTRLEPNTLVEWTCTDSSIDHPTVQKKDEWNGTKIRWEIMSTTNGNTLRVTHEGLTTELQCFDICEQGWNHYIGSIGKLINEGKGYPLDKNA